MTRLNIAGIYPFGANKHKLKGTEKLEEKLPIIEEQLKGVLQDNDIVVTPEYTYFETYSEEQPQISFKENGTIAGEKSILTHINKLQNIASESSSHLFLGTFKEKITANEEYFLFSNTALYLSPSGKIKPIRKICGSDSFKVVDRKLWEKFTKGKIGYKDVHINEAFYSQNKHTREIVEPYFQNSINTRVIKLNDDVKILPLICSEVREGIDYFKDLDVDILINMAKEGDLPTLELGSLLNLGSLEPVKIVKQPRNKEHVTSFINEKITNVLKPSGVYVGCDNASNQIGIYHPFSKDKQVSNYKITKNFVSGTAKLN